MTSENQWQPVRIAPVDQRHKGNEYWEKMVGKIIRVRPLSGASLIDDPDVKVFEIHPEDFAKMAHVPGSANLILEYHIQAD